MSTTGERLFSVSKIELRQEGETNRLAGYAAKFYDDADSGTQYNLGRDIVERISRTAFTRALEERQDVVALFDHSGLPLGRTSSGTMRLSTDHVGLRYEIDLPNTNEAKSIRELVSRGDLRGSSFGFVATREDWSVEGDKEIRTLLDLDLKDVGPVTMPAYNATTVSSRNLQFAQEALRMASYAIEDRYRRQLEEIDAQRKKSLEAGLELEALKVQDFADEDRVRRLKLVGARCNLAC
jgi:HK97 family phage prohead protease